MNANVKLVGILNVTPDSFSDGGEYLLASRAIEHGRKLIEEGAAVVEIGGDSTRPGSLCVGSDVEWQRIKDVLPELCQVGAVSIDTHHPIVAEKALGLGASFVNSMFATVDREMFQIMKGSSAKIVLMYSRCLAPHQFDPIEKGDILDLITNSLKSRIDRALGAGLRAEQLVLDPGMGAFLSDDPLDSWYVLEEFAELCQLGFPLMLACSRKGFLKVPGEVNIQERDLRSAVVAAELAQRIPNDSVLYVRAHNVSIHRAKLGQCND